MLPKVQGRPTRALAQKKRKQLLQVAFEEFLRKGFGGASIDGIAAAAGYSRTTIYALYTDKETLFRAVMAHEADEYAAQFMDLSTDRRPPEIVLKDAAKRMFRNFISSNANKMLRICIAEACSFPDIALQIREIMVGHSFKGLRAYFEYLNAEGVVAIDDVAAAATLFNMMTVGSFKPLLVPRTKFDRKEAARIEWAVDVFLRGCLLQPQGGALVRKRASRGKSR